jgi:hypothetical protein
MSDYFDGWANINCIDEKSGQVTTTGGTKHDAHKPDLSLVPLVAIEQLAQALMYGEKKYGRYNYTKGFNSNRLIAATLRHVHAWNSGEDNDKESGLSHIAHALAGLSMLLDCQRVGTLTDGRFKRGG